MITLIFGQLNCGKHQVANWLKSQADEEVFTLSDLREKKLKELPGPWTAEKMAAEYDMYYLTESELFLIAFCRTFTEKDVTIIVPNFCREAALRCCRHLSHVYCILVAPPADVIAKHRRANVSMDEYQADYFIPAEDYFNERSIHRNTARLVKETILMAKANKVVRRFCCYVSPEYLF